MPVINSGGACAYYLCEVEYPLTNEDPYIAECDDLIQALNLTVHEANAFKEIWRLGKARQGVEKEGNSPKRGAEKIIWNGKRMLDIANRREDNEQNFL